MSRADQVARAQRRAWKALRGTIPAVVTISDSDYEVALITDSTEPDAFDGTRTDPAAIRFWLRKEDHSTEPAMRSRITYAGVQYFIRQVYGRGDMHQNWNVRASRHAE